MKQCVTCQEWKEDGEFGKYSQSKDGLNYSCKQCRRKVASKYNHSDKRKVVERRYKRSEKGKEQGRRYRQTDKQKQTQKRYYYNKGLNHLYEYRRNNPTEHNARKAVAIAVRAGELPRAHTQKCAICATQARDYHHWSYEQEHWLDVIPLCRKCHVNIHIGAVQ